MKKEMSAKKEKTHVSLADALRQLGDAEEIGDVFPSPWLDETFAEGEPSLEPAEIRAQGEWCGLPPDAILDAANAAEQIAATPTATVLLRAFFRRIFLADGEYAYRSSTMERIVGNLADAVTLVLALGALPRIRAMHAKRGIPPDISRATCGQIAVVCENYHHDTGRNGMYPRQLGWFRYYLDPERLYLRVGRFEYMAKPFSLGLRVLRPRHGGAPVILAANGTDFDTDGLAIGPDAAPGEYAFTATLTAEKDALIGHPIDSVTGRCSLRSKRYSNDDYLPMLQPNDPVLDMHIPFGGGMHIEVAEESWRRAFDFYSRLLPEARRPRAICCASWVFNPDLQRMLAPDSNLVRLQRRVHLVPITTLKTSGLWFIFRQENGFDLATAPRQTSLQRAVAKYLESGRHWRIGAMILFPDEISDAEKHGASPSLPTSASVL